MKTQVLSCRKQPENGTAYGAELIKKGELVAFPTETVYGLGANGLNAEAVNKIFEAKGRPNDNPLILHVSNKNEVKPLWEHVPKLAAVLMDAFWPGPLTLIFNKSTLVPEAVTAGLDTVAVRMPENKTARALIKRSGVPIAAPSANLSGKPSPTTAQHVLKDMDGRIPLILDGGACRFGVESTVLSLVGTPTVLRPGAVTREMLEALIGPVKLADCLLKPLGEGETALSPGMKYKHYAPKARVLVINGSPEKAARRIRDLYKSLELEGKEVQIAATAQTLARYNGLKTALMGDRDEPISLCAGLFATLRQLDEDTDVILCEGIPSQGAGLAYMNRLLRAAGFDMENVD